MKRTNSGKYQVVPDYHMHTPRCNHATGTIAEYCQAAVHAGLDEIGMSDHSPMPNGFDKAWRMDESELGSFIAELEDAQAAFEGRLLVKSALEVDFYPGAEGHAEHLAGLYPWDYLMGSVHFIGEWGFDNPDAIQVWESKDINQAYIEYFELVAQSAATGLYDIIGHPDLIKKFGHRASSNSRKVEAAEDFMLKPVKAADVALEISSAGLRKPVGEIYPHPRIVAKAAALNIPFAFGSDAHSPVEVGHGMDESLTLLTSLGISEIATFTQRQRLMQTIVSRA